MSDFLIFFDTIVKVQNKPMHLEICYSKTMDWCIRVFRKSQFVGGENIEILYVESSDMEFAFAKAQVELKEWLSEKEGGY